jgi:MFS superfamily sulfate permease-like transporter
MGFEVLFNIFLVFWGFLWPSFIFAQRFHRHQNYNSVLAHLVVFGVLHFFNQLLELIIGSSTIMIVLKYLLVWILMRSDFRGSRFLFGCFRDYVENHRSLAYFASQANVSLFEAITGIFPND